MTNSSLMISEASYLSFGFLRTNSSEINSLSDLTAAPSGQRCETHASLCSIRSRRSRLESMRHT